MDSEQHMGNEETCFDVHEGQPLDVVSHSINPIGTHNLFWRNAHVKGGRQRLGVNAATTPWKCNAKTQVQNPCPTCTSRRYKVMDPHNRLIVLFCVLITSANIAVLSIKAKSHVKQSNLFGVDHVQSCAEKPGDKMCYEVRDMTDRLIYRLDGNKRLMGFSACGPQTPNTETVRCIGELEFAYNSSPMWSYRLYEDIESKSYSIVAGPSQMDMSDDVYKVRHILSPPFNWIISKEAIPRNQHPEYGLFIKGKVLFDT